MVAGVETQELRIQALQELSADDLKELLSTRGLSTDGSPRDQRETLRRAIEAEGPVTQLPAGLPADMDFPDLEQLVADNEDLSAVEAWLRDRGLPISTATFLRHWVEPRSGIVDAFCLAAFQSLPAGVDGLKAMLT